MNTPDKATQPGSPSQAGGPQQPDSTVAPRDSNREQQAGNPHKPRRFSQQLAQNIPSDPDPDDPASP